jgi:hypothetical protein
MRSLRRSVHVGVASLAMAGWLGELRSAEAQVNFNTIALSGETGTSLGLGPDLGTGVYFDVFGTPALNANGEVVFFAALAGDGVDSSNSGSVWTNVGGTLTVIARAGSDGPGPNVGPDAYFNTFNDPVLNAGGKVAFTAVINGPEVDFSNNIGVWTNASGTLTPIARAGSDTLGPNLGAGVQFFNFSNPVINSAGQVAFRGLFTGVSTGMGIWTAAGGTLTPVVRTGSDTLGPNLEAGVQFSLLNDPVISASGAIAFRATLTGSGVDDSNNEGIWSNAGGTLTPIARSGSDALGPNVGAGVTFDLFGNPVINASGTVAFTATLTGPGIDLPVNGAGLWTNAGGTLSLVARTGSDGPGPNLGDGVYFSSFNELVLNANGEMAFLANVTGMGVDGTNNTGLWTNAGGTLVNIVRKGDFFDVDPTDGVDLRTIAGIAFVGGAGGEDGRRLGFNDAGMLVFQLSFTDGSAGIFTAQLAAPQAIPEPAGIATLTLAAGALLLRRRR